MIEADQADYDRAKLDHDLIVSITTHGSNGDSHASILDSSSEAV